MPGGTRLAPPSTSSYATARARCCCRSGTTAPACRRARPADGHDGAGSPGHGLTGMRERATAAGGSLRTAAAPGGGFLVEATLPAKPELA